MTDNHAYPRILDALTDLRRRWRARKVIEGLLLALAGSALVLLAVVAADNWLRLETAGRLLLALVLWAALAAAAIGLVIRRWLEDRREDFFAALVEQKHPELRNLLINALQLGRQNHQGYSPRLVEAIVHDAAEAAAELEMRDSLDTRPTRRAMLVAGVGLFLLAGYATAVGPLFRNGLARVLMPGADIPPYTETQITSHAVKPGNRVAEGASVLVEARVQGVIPQRAWLHPTNARARAPVEMLPDPKVHGVFRCTLPRVADSLDYSLAAGDGKAGPFHLEVVKRPRVEGVDLAYAPPAYTGLPTREVCDADGEVAGIVGTRVRLRLRTTKPLKSASLITERGEPIALQRAEDDRTWEGSFVLWRADLKPAASLTGQIVGGPTRYRVARLEDADDHIAGAADADSGSDADVPAWHSLTVLRDLPPSVSITAPGQDVQTKPNGDIPVTVDAQDDFGVGEVRLLCRINEESQARELKRFPHAGEPQTVDTFRWKLADLKLKSGDVVQYWAEATDRNDLTGPGRGESRRFSVYILNPEEAVEKLDLQIENYVQRLEELLRLQQDNRAKTTSGVAFADLIGRQGEIRGKTKRLARLMEKDALPVGTIVKALDELAVGPMAEVVRILEEGKDAPNQESSQASRKQSLPIQDRIIRELAALLARLQRNEQAKEALRKLAKTDKPAHQAITKTLGQMIKDLDQMLKDQTELMAKFERLPKKPVDELNEDTAKGLKELEEFRQKWEKWAKGSVNELTKLPTGFVDDFGLRKDVNKIFEEIEKQANRSKAEKLEVSLEDLGAGLATRMKEDLEVWMPDSPDAVKWVLEEPLEKKPMKIPEMPLPKALEDMIGDLLQKADEFDEEADDITSAWGDNLDQAGWGVSDGPISTFSAKGKTGNDLPNNMEVNGRSGEGRRGKSTGQMVGDTVKGLQGRKTPARVGNERYEPGKLKQEGQLDPEGATGGGKKGGAGRRGLQGGTPPDFVRDMGRLSEKQAGLREKAEQVAKRLDTVGISSRRLAQGIELMKSAEKDLRDLRYQDAARKRRVALAQMNGAFVEIKQPTASQLGGARDLPPQLRKELLQGADEALPPGYEALLKSYYKALSGTDK